MYPHGCISNNIYHRGMHNIHLKLILLYNKTPTDSIVPFKIAQYQNFQDLLYNNSSQYIALQCLLAYSLRQPITQTRIAIFSQF